MFTSQTETKSKGHSDWGGGNQHVNSVFILLPACIYSLMTSDCLERGRRGPRRPAPWHGEAGRERAPPAPRDASRFEVMNADASGHLYLRFFHCGSASDSRRGGGGTREGT